MITARRCFDIEIAQRPNAAHATEISPMPIPRLYVKQTLAAQAHITLRDEAARYIGKVLRCRPGDALKLFDGSGPEYPATIVRISKQDVELRLSEATSGSVESALDVRLLQGISRGERMDFVVQKATELGVRRISPLQTEFSVVRLDKARAAKRQLHWQRIAESACEQCGRNVPPVIDEAQSFQDFLADPAVSQSTRLLLLPEAGIDLAAAGRPRAGVELFIGPEGGLSPGEVTQVTAREFLPVRIGPRVLRTETAALATLALVQGLWGDLGARDAD